MKALKKLFGGINMTWPKVIIFAVVTGVYTALINQVPFLANTSFTDIVVSFEWWILFAIIIAVNCKKPVESGLKVFVFFLISQPLVFLVETPFLGWSVWTYYKYWLMWTVLTLPGGMAANFVKKKNVLASLILSVAVVMLAVMATSYGFKLYMDFPHHLLTVLFCLIQIIVLAFVLMPKALLRAIPLVCGVVTIAVCSFIFINTEACFSSPLPQESSWSCVLENDNGGRIENDDFSFSYYYKPMLVSNNKIVCTNTKTGEKVIYDVVVGESNSVNVIPEEN